MHQDGLWDEDKSGKVIIGELHRLDGVVDAFFKAQKKVGEAKEMHFKINDAATYLKELVKEKRFVKEVRDKKIEIKYSENIQRIKPFKFDSSQMVEVFSALLDNAIYYTHSKILIDCKIEKDLITFSFQDDGIGISTDTMHKLFERFSRGENAVLARPDGSGLGLYLCRQIVSLHQGKIWAESPGEKQGSTFFVELPYKFE
jgi:signal transduction histidine kinase